MSSARMLVCCVALATVAAVVAPTAEARPAKRTCDPPGSQLVVANSYARVYWRWNRTDGQRTRNLFSCVWRTDRRRLHGLYGSAPPDAMEFGGISTVRLAGHFMAYGNAFGCDRYYGDCSGRIVVRDLRTGGLHATKRLETINAPPERPAGSLSVADLRLSRDGSAAFIAFHGFSLELWMIDAQGSTLLDSGNAIDSRSLALTSQRIYWMHDGQPRTASFRRAIS
jgi:hypothetical protein